MVCSVWDDCSADCDRVDDVVVASDVASDVDGNEVGSVVRTVDSDTTTLMLIVSVKPVIPVQVTVMK